MEAKWADLPLPIWAEIFHKLPLIWVGRCRRVCKQWCGLISDPLFVSNYNPNSIPYHPITLLIEWDDDFILLDPVSFSRRPFRSRGDFFPDDERRGRAMDVTVLGSCNGLVALHKPPGDFLLFNPCTKDEKRVQLELPSESFLELYGLCHDPARDEYKVVMCDLTSLCVLSLKDGSFSKLKAQSQLLQSLTYEDPEWVCGIVCQMATTVRGVPHWAVDAGGGVIIVYFDPVAEELQMVRFPDPTLSIQGFSLGALDGQLTLAVDRGKNLGYCVWGLNADYRNWTMLFEIPRGCCASEILGRLSDDEILLFGQFLVVYNMKSGRWRQLLWVSSIKRDRLIPNYTPSLVSPNHSSLH